MFFAGTPRLMLSRRLMHGGGKARVAAAASPATGNYETLVRLREFEHFFSGLVVVNNCSDGNLQNHVATVASGLVRTFAVASAFRAVFGIETEMHQRVVTLAGFHDHIAAFAAVPRLDPDFRLIDEHALPRRTRRKNKKPRPEGEAL